MVNNLLLEFNENEDRNVQVVTASNNQFNDRKSQIVTSRSSRLLRSKRGLKSVEKGPDLKIKKLDFECFRTWTRYLPVST